MRPASRTQTWWPTWWRGWTIRGLVASRCSGTVSREPERLQLRTVTEALASAAGDHEEDAAVDALDGVLEDLLNGALLIRSKLHR